MSSNTSFKPLWSILDLSKGLILYLISLSLIRFSSPFINSFLYSPCISFPTLNIKMDSSTEELWKKFRLSEEEKGVLSIDYQDVERSKEHAQFSLLFRLQTNKEFNKEAFKSTLQQLWKGSHCVTIKEVGSTWWMFWTEARGLLTRD